MSNNHDKRSFFRGLLGALVVVVFTQAWLWYAQNLSSEKAICDIKAEINENTALLDSLKQQLSSRSVPTEADWVRINHTLDKLSRAAYERSRPSFDNGSSNYHSSISHYYSDLRQLQGQADDAYEQTQQQSRYEERFEKQQDLAFQQMVSLTLSSTPNERTTSLFDFLSKKSDLLKKASTSASNFQKETSRDGAKLVLLSLKIVDSATAGAGAATDGLTAENQQTRILIIGFLFLMPFCVWWAVSPWSEKAALDQRSGNRLGALSKIHVDRSPTVTSYTTQPQ